VCVQESRRRQKEEDEVRRQRDRARKMAEFEKWKSPPKANFVISKRATADDGVRPHRPSSYYCIGAWVLPASET